MCLVSLSGLLTSVISVNPFPPLVSPVTADTMVCSTADDPASLVAPLVRSRPSIPICDTSYDGDGRLVRHEADSQGTVLMDRRAFRMAKHRLSHWVHAELARTLDAGHGLLIDASYIGRRGHAKEARSWVELTTQFTRCARLEREEEDPTTRMALDCTRLHVVTRARVGTHLGLRGTHDRMWQWRLNLCGIDNVLQLSHAIFLICCLRSMALRRDVQFAAAVHPSRIFLSYGLLFMLRQPSCIIEHEARVNFGVDLVHVLSARS